MVRLLLCLFSILALSTAQVKPGILHPEDVIWPRPNNISFGNSDNLC